MKKSFSLVEAAIYLMLVGVLTTAVIGGAALIEKAKIQKVIEDIDYYEKAFVQFTIQFGQVPGGLSFERCQENIDVFRECILKDKNKNQNGDNVWYQSSYFLTYGEALGANYVIKLANIQLKAFDEKMKVKANFSDGMMNISSGNLWSPAYNYDELDKYGAMINYNKNGRITMNCSINFNKNPVHVGDFWIVVQPRATFANTEIGFDRMDFSNASLCWANFQSLTPKNLDKNNGRGVGANALFSANFLKKVDRKIDTGLPRTGKIQGIKIDNGVNKVDSSKICYDKASGSKKSDLLAANYVNNRSTKYGCNMIRMLPDIWGYLY